MKYIIPKPFYKIFEDLEFIYFRGIDAKAKSDETNKLDIKCSLFKITSKISLFNFNCFILLNETSPRGVF